VLRFTTKNPEASSITLAAALERSNNNVNEQIAQTFESRFDAQRRNNNLAIEGLEEDKQKAIFDYNAANEVTLALLEEKMQILRSGYDAVKSAKLVMLAEQAQIARSLNLDKGAHATLEFANEGTTYLRGYLPIEQEITLIKSQSSPELLMLDYAMLAKEYALLKSRAPLELFIPELARIEWSIQQLLLNRVLKNAEALLTSTPIGTDQFNSAVYDLASIEYQSKTKSALILSLALVLGGMLGIFVLLIRNALIKSE
jgi:LPS O-antigen subunit length determinant protein (WzzB/FepE family)